MVILIYFVVSMMYKIQKMTNIHVALPDASLTASYSFLLLLNQLRISHMLP